ncbi:MAG: hypothetical protein RQ864_01205 [Lutibacter sp.]|nr:hypothetical protein [Lutibacter sp.]MDT8416400.1 hypothetical protein [Lutibacter sp.]
MKSNLFKYIQITSFLVALLFSINGKAQENDASNYNMSFDFKTVKQNDNSRLLEVSFTGKNKEDRKDILPIYGAEIKFFNILNDEEVLLGSAKTSQEGFAQITLPEDQKYLMDENLNINLMARFEGNDALEESSAELIVKNIRLELNLEELDSVKTVLVTAFTFDETGTEIPLEETDVIIYVQGMLSKMKIAEGTISEGAFEFEMPTDLPGDSNGNLIVYAIIDGHEEYGTVIQQKNAKWGIFEKQIIAAKNTLWSSAAPIWMYVVLTILLVGVWANYIYTLINLFKIKKEGQELEMETES